MFFVFCRKHNYKEIKDQEKGLAVGRKKLFFPINAHGCHWVLLVADMEGKTPQLLDPFAGEGESEFPSADESSEHPKFLKAIFRFLVDEHRHMKQPLNKSEWALIDGNRSRHPRQGNGKCVNPLSFAQRPWQHTRAGAQISFFLLVATLFPIVIVLFVYFGV